MKKITLLLLAVFATFTINAQTADEILDSYFENIGGKEKLRALKGMKIYAEVNQGMIIPLEIYKMKGGKEITQFTVQGKTLKQNVFDGETLWSTNFMTQKAEKSTAESTANHKLQTFLILF